MPENTRDSLISGVFATVDKVQRILALREAAEIIRVHRPIPLYTHFEAAMTLGRAMRYLKEQIEQEEDSAECDSCGDPYPLGELKTCFDCSERFCPFCRQSIQEVRDEHRFLPITDQQADRESGTVAWAYATLRREWWRQAVEEVLEDQALAKGGKR